MSAVSRIYRAPSLQAAYRAWQDTAGRVVPESIATEALIARAVVDAAHAGYRLASGFDTELGYWAELRRGDLVVARVGRVDHEARAVMQVMSEAGLAA